MKRIVSVIFLILMSVTALAADKGAQKNDSVVSETAKLADSSQEDAKLLFWKVPRKGAARLLPDISLIGSFAGAYFRDDPVGEQGENPSRTGFNLQSIELAIQAVVDSYVRGDIFILFKEDEVEIEEAFITTLGLPANLQVRAGIMLAPVGRLNSQHVEQWDFVDQSFTNRYFLGVEGLGEIGAELSVLFPTPWFSELTFGWYQGSNEDNFNSSSKADFAYLGKWNNFFDLTEDLGLQIGLAGILGMNDTQNLTQLYVADVFLRWRPNERTGLKWQTEYFMRRRKEAVNTLVEGGLYSQLVYQFARRWEAGLRADLLGLPSEGAKQQSVSPMLTFLASEYFRLRTQYNYVNVSGGRNQHQAFLQLVFNLGPHGAHKF